MVRRGSGGFGVAVVYFGGVVVVAGGTVVVVGFNPLRRRCCVASFGFGCSQRLLAVSAACLIFLRSNCVVGFALWFRGEFSCRRRMKVFLSRCGLISECEWILLSLRLPFCFRWNYSRMGGR
ncbi:hypothetical protein QL285_056840 [Trifolium repens]|nr:hypothetical protein QL285_056840 [Trifolium repens]